MCIFSILHVEIGQSVIPYLANERVGVCGAVVEEFCY